MSARSPITVRGAGRVADEPRAVLVLLTDIPTDDNLRSIHDHLRLWHPPQVAATSTQTKCEHMNFQATVNVGRLTDVDGGPITRYTTDITVHCGDCGLPFRFTGLSFGSSFAEPRLSADGLELRAPIEPAYVREILGHPLVAGTS